jgi:hypothetical protein
LKTIQNCGDRKRNSWSCCANDVFDQDPYRPPLLVIPIYILITNALPPAYHPAAWDRLNLALFNQMNNTGHRRIHGDRYVDLPPQLRYITVAEVNIRPPTPFEVLQHR